MNKIRLNKTILTLFVFMLLICVIPYDIITASSIKYPITFEGIAPNTPYTSSQFDMEIISGYLNITDTLYRTGTKSTMIYSAQTNIGYLHKKIGLFITKFEMYFRFASTGTTGANALNIYLCNDTDSGINYTTDYIARIRIDTSASYIYYYDSLNNPQLLYSGGSQVVDANWNHHLFMNFTDDIGSMQYAYFGVSHKSYKNVSAKDPVAISDGKIIDRIYFDGVASYRQFYMDDLNITISNSYTGEGGGGVGCLDITGLTQVGYFGSCISDSPSKYLTKTYNVPVTTTIYGIELQVGYEQILEDGDMANYDLSVNGFSLGMPTCSVLLPSYGILQWETDLDITNNLVTFQFYHSKKNSYGNYWRVGVGCTSNTDLDGDNSMVYIQTQYEVTYEWQWILFIPFYVPVSTPYDAIIDRDLAVKWWCDGFAIPEGYIYNYTDTLGLSKYEYLNDTGYIYNLSKGYTSIFGGYTLNDPLAIYRVALEINGVEYNADYYPLYCDYPGSTFGFSPIESGKYDFILNKDAVETLRVTAWVTGTLGNYIIQTNPPITNQYQSYHVQWRYYEPHGYPGNIGMSSLVREALNRYIDLEYTLPPIVSNTTGNYLYESYSSSAEYWGLYAFANNQHIKLADTTHIIRILSIHDCSIIAQYPSVIVGSDEVFNIRHMYPGGDVRVYVNGLYYRNVGDSQQMNITYTTTIPGRYTAQLILYQNGTTVILSQCTFMVTLPPKDDSKEDDFGFVTDFIPSEYRLYIGIGVIIGFTMFPMLAILSYTKNSKSPVTVPAMPIIILTIIMSLIGFILTIIWGLMPWYSVFLILFVLIIYLGILIYNKPSND